MFIKTTEQASIYNDLERKSALEIVREINIEDQKVALSVLNCLPVIASLVDVVYDRLANGGRLFYIGAGTSGRLGILDASECPPTYGVPFDLVIGLIAGGDGAIRKSVEKAEDDEEGAWRDMSEYAIDAGDVVIGIAASGTTPYVIGGLKKCKEMGIATGSISCNAGSPISAYADHAIEVVVGPEYVTGSTRMKSGTAQKMVLNMISTAVMIRLGRVEGNTMVDMQLSNVKLIDRGVKMVMQRTDLPYTQAQELLSNKGSVREAIRAYFDEIG